MLRREVLVGGQAFIEEGTKLIDAELAMKGLKVSIDNLSAVDEGFAELYASGQLTESDFNVWKDVRARGKVIKADIEEFRNLYCIVNKGYSLN